MVLVQQGFQYRFYPTKSQELHLAKEFGCARFVYNWALAIRRNAWRATKTGVGYVQCSEWLTVIKKHPETEWLKDVSAVTLQQSLRNLDRAFQRFFDKTARYPKARKRKGNQAVSYPTTGFKYSTGCLSVAKLGKLKIRWSRFFQGNPSSITISKNPAGQYFVSFKVNEAVKPMPSTTKAVGIDLGIKTFAVTSDGQEIQAPKPLKKYLAKLRKAQKVLSRKQKGSANREKAKLAIARIHNKVASIRCDFIHKFTTRIIRENQTVAVENLAVKNMVKNRKLARAISDMGWGETRRQLQYKAAWYGRTFVEIPRFFPSSKLCSECGHRLSHLLLATREWDCPGCGVHHDRDRNAARNILAAGQPAIQLVEAA